MKLKNIETGDIKELSELFPTYTFAYGIPSDAFLAEHGFEIARPAPAPSYVPTVEDITRQIEENKNSLWLAATAYQEKYISGAALSLLTLGVLQSKPKAIAIMDWIQTIWNDHYYVQKALVTENYYGYDFSVCGSMPYTVPELSAEVLG